MASIPSTCRLPEQSAFPSSSRLRNAARVAEIDTICLHIAFRSPEGHDAKSVENDWLRAGKRAMCVSIFLKGAISGMTHGLPKTGPEKLAQDLKDLGTRGDDQLKERWRNLYGTA